MISRVRSDLSMMLQTSAELSHHGCEDASSCAYLLCNVDFTLCCHGTGRYDPHRKVYRKHVFSTLRPASLQENRYAGSSSLSDFKP